MGYDLMESYNTKLIPLRTLSIVYPMISMHLWQIHTKHLRKNHWLHVLCTYYMYNALPYYYSLIYLASQSSQNQSKVWENLYNPIYKLLATPCNNTTKHTFPASKPLLLFFCSGFIISQGVVNMVGSKNDVYSSMQDNDLLCGVIYSSEDHTVYVE